MNFSLGFSWFTSWSFSWNAFGSAEEVAFPKIFAGGINSSLCAFYSVTSGISGDGFCSAFIKACAE